MTAALNLGRSMNVLLLMLGLGLAADQGWRKTIGDRRARGCMDSIYKQVSSRLT